MHIYAFGSVCRGEIDCDSDIDLLAVIEGFDPRFDPSRYSIYSYARLVELWDEGNPFAWHLALESRLLFADDGADYIKQLRRPSRYNRCAEDCEKFRLLFRDAMEGMKENPQCAIFELSTAFLAIRNIATCFSLGRLDTPVFGRHAALSLGNYSLRIDEQTYRTLASARMLSTRGSGRHPGRDVVAMVWTQFARIHDWIDDLVAEARQ